LTDDRNPEPHLPDLAGAMTEELQLLVGEDGPISDAQRDLVALIASVATSGPTPTTPSDREATLRALTETIGDRVEAEQSRGRLSSCDLEAFHIAIGGD